MASSTTEIDSKKLVLSGPLLFRGGEGRIKVQRSDEYSFNLHLESGISYPLERAPKFFYTENSTTIWNSTCEKHVGGSKYKSVALVEHLLAASLFSRPIRIDLYGVEVPIFDGSAKLFWEWIQNEGLLKTPDLYTCDLHEKYEWETGYLEVEPSKEFSVEYEFRNSHFSSKMTYTRGDDPKEILEARTFIFESHLKRRLESNDFLNPKEGMGLIIDSSGNAINAVLRHKNELAAHKILDLLGDLAVFKNGLPSLKIKCVNGSHRTNHQLVERIFNNVVT